MAARPASPETSGYAASHALRPRRGRHHGRAAVDLPLRPRDDARARRRARRDGQPRAGPVVALSVRLRPPDDELVAASEALEVAADDLLDTAQAGRCLREGAQVQLALAGAQLGVAEGERDHRLVVVEAHVELVAEVLGQLLEVRRRLAG